MTLRPGSGRGGVHLALFSEKVPALRCLLNDCPAALQSLQFLWIDVLGNIAVFVPFGAGLAVALPAGRPLAFWKAGSTATRHRRNRWGWWLRLAALGAAFSLCIELAQLGIPGRATDIDDVILNTVGTLIGGGIAMLVAAVLKRIA